MTLPSSGQITLLDVKAELGVANTPFTLVNAAHEVYVTLNHSSPAYSGIIAHPHSLKAWYGYAQAVAGGPIYIAGPPTVYGQYYLEGEYTYRDGTPGYNSAYMVWATGSTPTKALYMGRAAALDDDGIWLYAEFPAGSLSDGTYTIRFYFEHDPEWITYSDSTTYVVGAPTIALDTIYSITSTGGTAQYYINAHGKAIHSIGLDHKVHSDSTWINDETAVSPSYSTYRDQSHIYSEAFYGSTKIDVRAWVSSSYGKTYTSTRTFTTSAVTAPVLYSVNDSVNWSYTTATLYAHLTSFGGADTTLGVQWRKDGTSTWTTMNETFTHGPTNTPANNVFYVTGLLANTKYWWRSVAQNSATTVYGTEYWLQTRAYAAPTVTTRAASNVASTSATLNGNVTDDGGQTITERGFCYKLNSSPGAPTTSDTKVTQTGTTGVYSKGITGLTNQVTYKYRAYAINSQGTSYGSTVTFTTISESPQ